MELRFTFEAKDYMEQLENWGAFKVFPESVGQMDSVLGTSPTPEDTSTHE